MNLLKTLNRVIRACMNFPATLYINFRTLPLKQAIRLPMVVMSRTRFHGLKKGSIVIEAEIHTGMVQIGSLKTARRGLQASPKSFFITENGGTVKFSGKASFGKGTSICAVGGVIVFGNMFSCNVNCFIYCNSSIQFGEDVLLGWNVNIRDNDGHPMFDEAGNLINPPSSIEIGNRVWFASYVDVLKGVKLANGVIVGTRSLVTKSILSNNSVVGGVPAKVIKDNIIWYHNLNSRSLETENNNSQ